MTNGGKTHALRVKTLLWRGSPPSLAHFSVLGLLKVVQLFKGTLWNILVLAVTISGQLSVVSVLVVSYILLNSLLLELLKLNMFIISFGRVGRSMVFPIHYWFSIPYEQHSSTICKHVQDVYWRRGGSSAFRAAVDAWLGIPEEFVGIVKSFYESMTARISG